MSALDLPLYRQAQIFARQNVQLDRSTLADWIGRAAWWLTPLRNHLLGRPQNLVFLGSDKGSDRAAIIYTALQTARLTGVDPKPGSPTSSTNSHAVVASSTLTHALNLRKPTPLAIAA